MNNKLQEAAMMGALAWDRALSQLTGTLPKQEQVRRYMDTSPAGMERRNRLMATKTPEQMEAYHAEMRKLMQMMGGGDGR